MSIRFGESLTSPPAPCGNKRQKFTMLFRAWACTLFVVCIFEGIRCAESISLRAGSRIADLRSSEPKMSLYESDIDAKIKHLEKLEKILLRESKRERSASLSPRDLGDSALKAAKDGKSFVELGQGNLQSVPQASNRTEKIVPLVPLKPSKPLEVDDSVKKLGLDVLVNESNRLGNPDFQPEKPNNSAPHEDFSAHWEPSYITPFEYGTETIVTIADEEHLTDCNETSSKATGSVFGYTAPDFYPYVYKSFCNIDAPSIFFMLTGKKFFEEMRKSDTDQSIECGYFGGEEKWLENQFDSSKHVYDCNTVSEFQKTLGQGDEEKLKFRKSTFEYDSRALNMDSMNNDELEEMVWRFLEKPSDIRYFRGVAINVVNYRVRFEDDIFFAGNIILASSDGKEVTGTMLQSRNSEWGNYTLHQYLESTNNTYGSFSGFRKTKAIHFFRFFQMLYLHSLGLNNTNIFEALGYVHDPYGNMTRRCAGSKSVCIVGNESYAIWQGPGTPTIPNRTKRYTTHLFQLPSVDMIEGVDFCCHERVYNESDLEETDLVSELAIRIRNAHGFNGLENSYTIDDLTEKVLREVFRDLFGLDIRDSTIPVPKVDSIMLSSAPALYDKVSDKFSFVDTYLKARDRYCPDMGNCTRDQMQIIDQAPSEPDYSSLCETYELENVCFLDKEKYQFV